MNWFTLDIFRQILMVLGTIVISIGWKDQETVQGAIGVIMTLAGAAWQLFDHNKVQTEVKGLKDQIKGLKGLN
jgi:hypothetical protein